MAEKKIPLPYQGRLEDHNLSFGGPSISVGEPGRPGELGADEYTVDAMAVPPIGINISLFDESLLAMKPTELLALVVAAVGMKLRHTPVTGYITTISPHTDPEVTAEGVQSRLNERGLNDVSIRLLPHGEVRALSGGHRPGGGWPQLWPEKSSADERTDDGGSRHGGGGGGTGGGGGGGNGDGEMPPDDGLKRRVEALEKKLDADVTTLRGDIRELRIDMASLNKSIGEVSGKVSQLPSVFQIAGLMITTMGVLSGLVFGIAKLMK